jgi:hypothetical protein
MRVADVRKRYPKFFVTVEAAAWDDMQMDFKRGIISDTKVMRRIAYNAAAIATLELHKIASRKKIIVAGKTSPNSAMVPCWVYQMGKGCPFGIKRCPSKSACLVARHQ